MYKIISLEVQNNILFFDLPEQYHPHYTNIAKMELKAV